jgi:hypothetical protein
MVLLVLAWLALLLLAQSALYMAAAALDKHLVSASMPARVLA